MHQSIPRLMLYVTMQSPLCIYYISNLIANKYNFKVKKSCGMVL